MSTRFYIRIRTGAGEHWVLRWPNGSPRKFRTLDAAWRCLRYLPMPLAQSAEIVPVARYGTGASPVGR